MPIEETFSILTRLGMVSEGILLDHTNRSKIFNFDTFFNSLCKKSYLASQVEATFSSLTRS